MAESLKMTGLTEKLKRLGRVRSVCYDSKAESANNLSMVQPAPSTLAQEVVNTAHQELYKWEGESARRMREAVVYVRQELYMKTLKEQMRIGASEADARAQLMMNDEAIGTFTKALLGEMLKRQDELG